MADGTAVTALEGKRTPLESGRPDYVLQDVEDSRAAARRPRKRRSNDRAILPLALLASLAVHAGALAAVLMVSAQFAPEPHPVAGGISIGLVASDGSAGPALTSVQDTSAGNEATQAQPTAEVETLAAPQTTIATAIAVPSIEALMPPESDLGEEPSGLLKSPAEVETETTPPVLSEIEPVGGATSPQALLFEATEPKRVLDVSQATTTLQQVSLATPPLPARKPRRQQSAQAAAERAAPSSAERLDEKPTENEQRAAAAPKPSQQRARENAGASAERAKEDGRATESSGSSGSGGAGSSPRFAGQGLSNPAPRYPHLARKKGQEGRVILRVRVSADGNAQSVVVRQSSGYPLLDDAAAKTIRRWRFVPASFAGVTMAGMVDIPVTFRLTDQ